FGTNRAPRRSHALSHAAASDVDKRQSEIHSAASTNLDFLAALALPTVYQYAFPDVFLSVWQWLCTYISKTRDFSQLALGLPRGFGNTMVIKLFILYTILF
ncbi:hypothetical protein DD878_13555, partial [Staphylococcus pseudintermedius]